MVIVGLHEHQLLTVLAKPLTILLTKLGPYSVTDMVGVKLVGMKILNA